MEMERGQEDKTPAAFSPWDCGSPLYDACELASVYRVLDSHLMALPFARDMGSMGRATATARRTAAVARANGIGRRRRTAAKAARRTCKAVLHSIYRSVTCSRKLP